MPEVVAKKSGDGAAAVERFLNERDPAAAFSALEQKFGIQFQPTSLFEQGVITTPTGLLLSSGKALADSFTPSSIDPIFAMTDRILAKLPPSKVSNGSPDCRKCQINGDFCFGLQIGFNNIVRSELPTFTLTLVSKQGFSFDAFTALIGNEPAPKFLLINTLSGIHGDISFLQNPYSKMVLNPDSLEQCSRLIDRFIQMAQSLATSPADFDPLRLPPPPEGQG